MEVICISQFSERLGLDIELAKDVWPMCQIPEACRREHGLKTSREPECQLWQTVETIQFYFRRQDSANNSRHPAVYSHFQWRHKHERGVVRRDKFIFLDTSDASVFKLV